MKCQICYEGRAVWSWQPLGPQHDANCFRTPGSHYRGFALIKICQPCYAHIKAGVRFEFDYKGQRYTGTVDEAPQVVEKSEEKVQ